MDSKINVIKRDGTVQLWDFNKLLSAVKRAFDAANEQMTDKFVDYLKLEFEPYLSKGEDLNVEQIHDIVRNLFIKKNKYNVVDNFIRWRKEREEIRESKSDLINDIHKALTASDVQNQNANVDETSFGGRVGEAARIVCKKEALRNMRKQSRKNHENNEIYIHDLDSWETGMHNCLSIPFDDLLKNGFNTRQCNIRGAKSVNTAFQLIAVIFQIQSLQQFGGVAATHLDWTMVPYVRYSFFKHYIDGLKYINKYSDDDISKFKSQFSNEFNMVSGTNIFFNKRIDIIKNAKTRIIKSFNKFKSNWTFWKT